MFGFAKKIGMTRLFVDGKHVPVTVLQFDDNFVAQIRTEERDGYKAIQIVSVKRNPKNSSKARTGHLKTAGLTESDFHCIGEFKDAELPEGKKVVTVEDIKQGDVYHIAGTTIGRGFTGPVKRYNFAGGPRTHGNKHQERKPGSIGATGPQRVFKGLKSSILPPKKWGE